MNLPPNNEPAVSLNSEEQSSVDERGRAILYGLISTVTVAIASYDPQMEYFEPILRPVGYGGVIGCTLAGLRHIIIARRSERVDD